MIRVPRWKILATMIFCGMLGSVATWGLTAARADTDITAPSVYRNVRGEGPLKLKVRDHCLQAEDSAARLILVKWEGQVGPAVYRCHIP